MTLLVGAGLSMSAPSNLPSAWRVARACYDRFAAQIGPLPPHVRDDLEGVAKAIGQAVDFRNIFIRTIVPWEEFVAQPNEGHTAVADFLMSGSARACLSSNYDTLVERAGEALGADLQTAIAGHEATEISATQSPLLKFHGCMNKDRDRTVWTKDQFADDPELEARRLSNVEWMNANLQHKDLLIVGFWSDWSYLNDVFEGAIANLHPLSITIVDPQGEAALAEKAPGLWAMAHQQNVTFTHVQALSHDFLRELQDEIGKSFFRQLLAMGATELEALRPGTVVPPEAKEPPNLSHAAYYSWRRDAMGISPRRAVRRCSPEQSHQATGLAHTLVLSAGAVASDEGYRLADTTVRVVNGAGRQLTQVQETLAAGPAVVEADLVICAGATDYGVPGNIIRDQQPATTVRPGVEGRWVTLPTAIEELGL